MTALAGGGLVLLVCLCFGLVALLNPGVLPAPVAAALPLRASPSPLPTLQATRAPVALPTQSTAQEQCSRRGQFCLEFPPDWLVIDQGLPAWQRQVTALSEAYSWAPALFVASSVSTRPVIRAVLPDIVDPAAGRVARFSAGEADPPVEPVTVAEIERLVREEPERLALLLRPVDEGTFVARRFQHVQIGQREAAMVEFSAVADIDGATIPVGGRLYLAPAAERFYVLSYLADEASLASHRPLFENVVQSFTTQE